MTPMSLFLRLALSRTMAPKDFAFKPFFHHCLAKAFLLKYFQGNFLGFYLIIHDKHTNFLTKNVCYMNAPEGKTV